MGVKKGVKKEVKWGVKKDNTFLFSRCDVITLFRYHVITKPIFNSQFSILNFQFSIFNFQFSIFNTPSSPQSLR